ncbi:hypothetical protein J437_LFUL014505 [Ladona fulva]|uniref:Uncharacterized protein n=1 Tax=Ladona fulva TaxID=123851 RepID=A0A8K0KKC9_LADFU|nr:hypothetical protein J437_LFUL014505 [Ladona fulva]
MGLMNEHLVMRSTIFTLPADLSDYMKHYRQQKPPLLATHTWKKTNKKIGWRARHEEKESVIKGDLD